MNSLISASLRGIRIGVENEERASAEDSVPYDPQTNGAAESAVRLIKGHIRALQVTLELRLQVRIPVSHPILTWAPACWSSDDPL